MKDLRSRLQQLKFDHAFLQRVDCSPEESERYLQMMQDGITLPEHVFQKKDEKGRPTASFYQICEADLTQQEQMEYLALLKSARLRTIKNSTIYIAILITLLFIALLRIF